MKKKGGERNMSRKEGKGKEGRKFKGRRSKEGKGI
jgi:hypothetical protein